MKVMYHSVTDLVKSMLRRPSHQMPTFHRSTGGRLQFLPLSLLGAEPLFSSVFSGLYLDSSIWTIFRQIEPIWYIIIFLAQCGRLRSNDEVLSYHLMASIFLHHHLILSFVDPSLLQMAQPTT